MPPLPPKPPLKPQNVLNHAILPTSVSKNVVEPRPSSNPFNVASKVVVPNTALPNSATATLLSRDKISALGISKYITPLCEQRAVFSILDPQPYTERAIEGMRIHQELKKQAKVDRQQRKQQLKENAEARIQEKKLSNVQNKQIVDMNDHLSIQSSWKAPWTTPEEHAAHLFIIASNGIEMLRKNHRKEEFSLFGFEFDRALHGSVDSIELAKDHEMGKAVTIRLGETKTTHSKELPPPVIKKAVFQASLYMHFLKRMLDKKNPFNFARYFEARGLGQHRTFNSSFASAFAKIQDPSINPLGMRPKHLNDLAEQWGRYVQTLPEFIFDPRVFITTVRLGYISSVDGFGRTVMTTTRSYLSREEDALELAGSVADLLDGQRAPKPIPLRLEKICHECPYRQRCPWRPDLNTQNTAPELSSPIRPPLAQTPAPDSLSESPSSFPIPSSPPTPSSPSTSSSPPTPSSPRTEKDLIPPEITKLPSLDSNTQSEGRTTIIHNEEHSSWQRVLENLNLSNRIRQRIKPRSEYSLELSGVQKEKTTRPEYSLEFSRVQRKKITLSTKERRYLAKQTVVYGLKRTASEAKKIERVQAAAQMRMFRERLERYRKAAKAGSDKTRFTGIVPYVSPTRASSDVVLFTPSLARTRMKRREAERAKKMQHIPHSGQALPEDETYSAAKLRHIPKSSQAWTYQFDSLPSLAEQQTALIKKEAEDLSVAPTNNMEVLTDAEVEENEREARRALRRRERQG